MNYCGDEFLEHAEILTKINETWTQIETRHSTECALLRAKQKYLNNVDGLAGPLAGLAGWADDACWAWAVWAVDRHTIKTIENETF